MLAINDAGAACTWQITDHVCRVCFGRVLRSLDRQRHRCADCGATGGNKVTDLCACGAMLHTKANAGLRCIKNPDGPTAECPAEIIVDYVGIAVKPAAEKKPKNYGGRLFDEG